MKSSETERFISHCDKYFEQSNCIVLHATNETTPHIDVLRYPPTEKYPFWKLVTMGASDYKMPKDKNSLGNRNEYMMFIDPELNLEDREEIRWYYNILIGVADYPRKQQLAVTYGHSIEWGETEEDCDMEGAFLEMPCAIQDTGILRCKLGIIKTAVCLQIITLTRGEINKLLEVGPERYSELLYPDFEEKRPHFLCEKKRTDKF